MNIREATEADLRDLMELNRQIGELHFQNAPNVFAKPSSEARLMLLEVIKDIEQRFWVAVEGCQVIGFLTAKIKIPSKPSPLSKNPVCWITSIVVDESARSQGIGSHLIKKSREWAKTVGARELRLEVMEFNQRAQNFYENIGLSTLSRTMSVAL